MLHPPEQLIFLEVLVEKKAFCFSKRTLSVGIRGNKQSSHSVKWQESSQSCYSHWNSRVEAQIVHKFLTCFYCHINAKLGVLSKP